MARHINISSEYSSAKRLPNIFRNNSPNCLRNHSKILISGVISHDCSHTPIRIAIWQSARCRKPMYQPGMSASILNYICLEFIELSISALYSYTIYHFGSVTVLVGHSDKSENHGKISAECLYNTKQIKDKAISCRYCRLASDIT